LAAPNREGLSPRPSLTELPISADHLPIQPLAPKT
jgi:hypothetical protein